MKKRWGSIPLWLIFLGVQFVDLLWAVLLLIGVERASYNPDASVFLRAVYEYYPYSHSLITTASIALLASFLVYRFLNTKWATVTGLAIVSHWFLDLIVHVPDVPLFFNLYKFGFGLWNYPVLTLVLEVALLSAAFWYLWRGTPDQRVRKWMFGLYAFLTVFYAASFFAPAVPPTAMQVGIFGILVYGGVPLVAYFAERRKSQV